MALPIQIMGIARVCKGSVAVIVGARETTPYLGENSVRMWLHASVVVGETLYIDGGEVNFNTSNGNNGDVPMNDTLAIDLSQSWQPVNAPIKVTAKSDGVPILNGQSLWAAPDNSSFYSFGGDLSNCLSGSVQDFPVDLWRFEGQAWNQVQDQSDPPKVRPAGGSSAFSVESGYILGGFQGNDFDAQGDLWPMPGLVSYNSSSNSWSNSSSTRISDFGTIVNGGMQSVANFGPEGLLVAMGGESGPVNAPWVEQGSNFAPFSNISIYDIATDNWYWQTATGATGPEDIPPNGTMFCITGVQSNQRTFEVFIYGGHDDNLFEADSTAPSESEQEAQTIFNLVYVLSLPGFVWFKSNDTSAQSRTGHTCELIGNRQMVSVGGINPALGLDGGLGNADPWPQGLGIFDVVELEWTNAYNAMAEQYMPATPIQNWYNNPSSNSSVQWTSPQVFALFFPSPTATPSPQYSSTDGLSKNDQIALGIGIPSALATIATLGVMLRNQYKKKQSRERVNEKLHAIEYE